MNHPGGWGWAARGGRSSGQGRPGAIRDGEVGRGGGEGRARRRRGMGGGGVDSIDEGSGHAETVLRTNFYGAKMLTEALLPLFRRSPATSRILNISSQLGLLNKVSDPELKRLLQDEERLTEAEVEGMASRFLAQVKDGTWRGQGWPKVWTDYSVSKLALNAYARVLARRLQARGDRVSVNCFCPGFTRTDMTRGWGKRTAEEAAEIGARLALLPPGELPTGTFFKWCTPQLYSKL